MFERLYQNTVATAVVQTKPSLALASPQSVPELLLFVRRDLIRRLETMHNFELR